MALDAGEFCFGRSDSAALAAAAPELEDNAVDAAVTRPILETKPEPVAPTTVEVVWTRG